jgi:ribosomal protein S18 acetylase RimI-like enzyme
MRYGNPAIRIETLRREDLPAALEIQSAAYPAFLVEDEPAFLSRINLTASYCLAAKRGAELVGYLLAHGWEAESPPPVGAILTGDGPGEVLYIHDLATASSGRGLGVGRSLITRAFELAERDGIARAELIAVEGAADYWRGLGFLEPAISDDLEASIANYGASARWMARDLPSGF